MSTRKVAIDTNIPVPAERWGGPHKSRRGPEEKYPWATMKVGDSFLADVKSTNSIQLSKGRAEKRYKILCISRTTPDGVRVWRVK
jgi:hypothetical protein